MRRAAAVVVVMLAVGGHAVAEAPVGAVAVIDRPVAFIGRVALWQSEVDRRALPGTDPARVLDDLIETELLVQEAARNRIEVEDHDVEAALTEIKTKNNLDDAGFAAVLKQSGMTVAGYREELRRQLLVLRVDHQVFLSRVTVDDAEVTKEVARRGGGTDRTIVKAELVRRQTEVVRTAWLAEARKRVRVPGRP